MRTASHTTKTLFLRLLLASLLLSGIVFWSNFTNANVKAQDETVVNSEAQNLVSKNYEYDLTKLIVQQEGEDKPELVILEEIEQEKGFISSRELNERNSETVLNYMRYDRLREKLTELEQSENVVAVQPSYIYTSEAWARADGKDTPDDFDLNPSALNGNHWYYERSNLRNVWNDQDCFTGGESCGGSSEVVVAVIDTGLAFEDYTSVWVDIESTPFNFDPVPDMFTGGSINLYTNSGETPNNGIDDDANGFIDDYQGVDTENFIYCVYNSCSPSQSAETGHPNDDGGHGTYVTGLIASLVDNASGSVSPAHQVTIMPIKANFLKQPSFGTLELMWAIEYAVEHGADIINMSLAGPSPDVFLEAVINEATEAGVLVIAASGNNGGPVYYPAKYKNVVAVGAVTASGTKTEYSAFGPELDLVAYVGNGGGKGDSVYQMSYSCFGSTPSCYNSTNTARYTQFSSKYAIGTSFAAPQASAAAALIVGNNPGINLEETKLALLMSTDDITIYGVGADNETGKGVLNYWKAGSFLLSDMSDVAYLPAYRNSEPKYNAWAIVGNPSLEESLNAWVIHKGGEGNLDVATIGPNSRYSFSFPGAIGGPVKIMANSRFYATVKSEVNGGPDEIAFFSEDRLDTEYYFTAYRWQPPKYAAWIIVGNPNDSGVEVEVTHSGTNGGTQTKTISANSRDDFKFEGATGGPVKVRATDGTSPIYATIKSEVNGYPNETEGVSFAELDTEYYYPAYRSQPPKYAAWIIVGNPNDSTVEVEVTHFGVNGGIQTKVIPANDRMDFKFINAREGPIKVKSTDGTSLIYTTIKSEVSGGPAETPGIAASALDSKYYYPAYRSQPPKYAAWIIVGNPNTETVEVTVQHFGSGGGIQTQTISAGDRHSFKFNNAIGGPVTVTSSGGNVYTTIKSEVNGLSDETAGISETSIGL